ncbi:MAG TPA: proline dehydrogenase family protein [Alphaproteobacteria bacterium]|nr:proline dehydrogenase family protein [Alphaproteobacteria bacterium]
MVRRAWQSAMIGLARSRRLKRFMQSSRATSFLACRYVAGKTAAEGVGRALELYRTSGIRGSLFYMGEYVDDLGLVEDTVEQKLQAAKALAEAGLDIHISVDPTQIGHQLDPSQVAGRAARIADAIRALAGETQGVHCLMLDMEDASLNDPTIALHDHLQDQGLPVALTLQAYLRRTWRDMERQVARGSRVRLVKGAFAAGADTAFTARAEIKANSRRLIDLMLSPQAREAGFYPIFATHDTQLHDYAVAAAGRAGWQAHEYEFEMLLGVRQDAALALARKGERVRLYLPFGQDWWPYAVRRIGENPANAWLLARSLLN